MKKYAVSARHSNALAAILRGQLGSLAPSSGSHAPFRNPTAHKHAKPTTTTNQSCSGHSE